MIDVDEIGSMQIECVKRWHLEPIDNPCDIDGSMSSLAATVCQQHQFNYLLWHEEDIARSREVTDSQIATVKRNIDRFNQSRNDWIERIDDFLHHQRHANVGDLGGDQKYQRQQDAASILP